MPLHLSVAAVVAHRDHQLLQRKWWWWIAEKSPAEAWKNGVELSADVRARWLHCCQHHQHHQHIFFGSVTQYHHHLELVVDAPETLRVGP
jgi:hypothetical protein